MRVKRADGGSCELITERSPAKVTKNSLIARAIYYAAEILFYAYPHGRTDTDITTIYMVTIVAN